MTSIQSADMLTATELNWIRQAMRVEHTSAISAAKTYRVIGQLFENAAKRIELDLVDKVENRLYNTNTETEGATNA